MSLGHHIANLKNFITNHEEKIFTGPKGRRNFAEELYINEFIFWIKMKAETPTDYFTYKEIMEDLLDPIIGEDLDNDTLKRLYESKLVYLENLRVTCFYEMNSQKPASYFSVHDYNLILQAIDLTHNHLRELILMAITYSLESRSINAN